MATCPKPASVSPAASPTVAPPGSPLQPRRVGASVFTSSAGPAHVQLTRVCTCTHTPHTLPRHHPTPPGHPGCGPVALREPHQAASFSPDSSRGAVQGWAGLSSPTEPPPPPRGPLSPCGTRSQPVTPAASPATALPQQRTHSKTLLEPVGTIGLPLPLTEGSSCVWGSHS